MVLYARDIVQKDFLTVGANSSVLEGAKAMKRSSHGWALVGTTADPQGVVTEWDILSKVIAEGWDPQKVTMGEIMSTTIVSVDSGAALSEVSQLMTERGVRRLLVKEGNQIVGFITSKTILARMNEYVDKISAQISRLQTPPF